MVKRALTTLLIFILMVPLVEATQCSQRGWKKLQSHQLDLESYYNTRATQYNALLGIHKQRRLLSQQFTFDELVQLWQHADPIYHRDFEQQIRSARQYANAVTSLKQQLIDKQQEAKTMAQNWFAMAHACKQQKYTANFNSALWYSRSSKDLAQELTKLEQKFTLLGHIYENEATQLENAQLYSGPTN
ncbi:hypothetical protein QTV44_000366 [Vibrio vulnificus]|nr:hypothetical protein [Vibrio vulnificus]